MPGVEFENQIFKVDPQPGVGKRAQFQPSHSANQSQPAQANLSSNITLSSKNECPQISREYIETEPNQVITLARSVENPKVAQDYAQNKMSFEKAEIDQNKA